VEFEKIASTLADADVPDIGCKKPRASRFRARPCSRHHRGRDIDTDYAGRTRQAGQHLIAAAIGFLEQVGLQDGRPGQFPEPFLSQVEIRGSLLFRH
jgi:hypothetical protein